MPTIPIAKWDMRNVWPLPSNELAVRQGFTKPLSYSFSTSVFAAMTIVSGFSVKNPRTDMVYHYLLTNTSGTALALYIADEDWNSIQAITLPLNSATADTFPHIGFSYALVEDEILVTSPFFASYWGIVGGPLIVASKIASVNPDTTALNVPKGISVGWAGRAVVGSPDGSMWFSDALFPRTYVGFNAINPPGGSIYGLHVNAGGALIVCTSTGVYSLPEDASATGQIVVGIFSKLSDYACIQYDTTCVCKGRVFGLTERGYALIDTQTSEETELDDKFGNHSNDGRMHFANYKLGRIYGGNDGPIVTISGYSNFTHLSFGFKSWWTYGERQLDITGLCSNDDGEQFYLTRAAPLFKCADADEIPVSTVFGRYDMSAQANPVIRRVIFRTNAGLTRKVKINGVTVTDVVTAVAPVCGTDSWGSGVYREDEILTCVTDWAVRTNNVAVELTFTGYGAMIPTYVDVVFRGPGKRRVI